MCPASSAPMEGDVPVGVTAVHVRAGAASEGADGTEPHPYPTLQEALRDTSGERWFVLAAGTYDGPVVLPRAAHIVGVCAARVVLNGDASAPVVTADYPLDLRGVTVRGGAGGVHVTAATTTLRRVVISASQAYGVLVEGAGSTLDAEDLLVRGVSAPRENAALSVKDSGTLRVTRAVIASVRAHGVRAEGSATTARLRDVALSDLTGSSTTSGIGLYARGGATLTAERVVVDRATENSAYATTEGRIALTDTVLRRARGFTDGTQGLGAVTNGRGHIEITRGLIEDCRQGAAVADGQGSDVTLHECVIRRTAALGAGNPRAGTMGTGFGANNGATATADHTRIEESHDQGVIAYRAGSTVTLTECEVRATAPRGDGTQGVGVVAHTNARVTLRRVLVRDNTHVGVIAYGSGAVLDAHDVMVTGTRALMADAAGASLVAHTGGAVTGDHLALSNNIDAALEAYGAGSTVVLEDVVIAPFDDAARPRGFGAVAAADGAVTLTRVGVRDVDGAGLAALLAEASPGGASLTATDAFVETVTPRRFGGAEAPFGYALAVERSRMTLARATVLGGEYGFVVNEGNLALTEAVVFDASEAVGVVNASPEVSLGTVSSSSRGRGVLRDVSVEQARVPPPPAPQL